MPMKRILFSVATVVAMAAPALAADLRAPVMKAPPMAVTNWTGCYLAGGGGYGLWDQTVTSLNSNTVSLIDPSFRQQTAIEVGSQPMDMAFRGEELFVACKGDGSIHVIDIPRRRAKRSFRAGAGCECLGFF